MCSAKFFKAFCCEPGLRGHAEIVNGTVSIEALFSSAFMHFENGASLNLEVSWMLHHNMPDHG